MSHITTTMLTAVWIGMLLGVVSGAIIGIYFTREDWMGGYASHRRRLTRLGHISFFGLAFVNAIFAFTHHVTPIRTPFDTVALWALIAGAVTMPTVCFLCAWRKPWRHLFFIPVVGVLTGILCVLFAR